MLSVFLPNVVVCTLMTPVAVAMLRYAGEPPASRSRLAVPLLLAVAWGTGIGGVGSPLGGAAALSRLITMLPLSGGAMTILALTLFCVVLTEISSNTAAAAIAIPIIQSLTETMGLSPIPYLLLATAAVNTAYILPVSIRAIPVSYGLDASAMARWGALASVLSILAITALGSLFLYTWPGFSAL